MVDFKQEFNLMLYEEYNQPICYRTEEFFNGIRVINGFYLNKSPIFGVLPSQIVLKLEFSFDKEENKKIVQIFNQRYMYPKKKRVYKQNNKIYCHSVLTFQKLADGQTFYIYRGEEEWVGYYWDQRVKEVYFHNKILGEEYPFEIPLTLFWEEIPVKNDDLTFDFR